MYWHFTLGLLEAPSLYLKHNQLENPNLNLFPPPTKTFYRMNESSMSPESSISDASTLVDFPTTESTVGESHQISTISSEIEAIVENLETDRLRLRDEVAKVSALVAEKEELLGQLATLLQVVENQVQAIENLQDERNHFLMLLLGVCAGLFFVIFGQS